LPAGGRGAAGDGTQAHRGRVFRSAGDSVVAEFPSAVEALNCAVEIRQEMDDRNEAVAKDERLEFRIGLNIGDVMGGEGARSDTQP
jgi:adenylate cyclase